VRYAQARETSIRRKIRPIVRQVNDQGVARRSRSERRPCDEAGRHGHTRRTCLQFAGVFRII